MVELTDLEDNTLTLTKEYRELSENQIEKLLGDLESSIDQGSLEA